MPTIPAINLAPSVVFRLGFLPVTTTFLLQLLVCAIIVITFSLLAKNYRQVPGKFQLLIEDLLMAA